MVVYLRKISGRELELTIDVGSRDVTVRDVLQHPSSGRVIGNSGSSVLEALGAGKIGAIEVNNEPATLATVVYDESTIVLASKIQGGC
jgi:hypothetical protein